MADLAAQSGASVEIVSVVKADLPILGLPPQTLIEIDKAIFESRRLSSEKLARPLRRREIEVACTVLRNDTVSAGIAQRLDKSPADLVAIEAHKHTALARLFFAAK